MTSNYGQFFIRKDIFENTMKIPNEKIFYGAKNIEFSDAKLNLKVPGLDISISGHRILLTHETNQQLAFYCDLKNIIKHKVKVKKKIK